MAVQEKPFSLFDFCKKRAEKVQVYGPETLDEEGNIIPFIDQAAIITHYLHLKGTRFEKPYKEKAEQLLPIWEKMIAEELGEPTKR